MASFLRRDEKLSLSSSADRIYDVGVVVVLRSIYVYNRINKSSRNSLIKTPDTESNRLYEYSKGYGGSGVEGASKCLSVSRYRKFENMKITTILEKNDRFF